MATEVLLMTNVPQLGVEGDIVRVTDGYARNYLFPKSLAAPVSEETRRRLEKMRRRRAEAAKAELAAATELAAKLAAASCTMPVKVGEDGKLFGSVTTAAIAESLAAQGIEVDRHKVELEAPLKELGVFDVRVNIHPEIQATVRVWVVEE